RSAGSISGDDGTGCLQKNFHIEPRRTLASIAQIEANHFIKSDSTPSLDLPESSDSRLRLEQATAVPWGVSFDFIWHGGTRSDQRHLSAQYIDELGQLIEAGSTQEISHRRDAWIIRQLEDRALASI